MQTEWQSDLDANNMDKKYLKIQNYQALGNIRKIVSVPYKLPVFQSKLHKKSKLIIIIIYLYIKLSWYNF